MGEGEHGKEWGLAKEQIFWSIFQGWGSICSTNSVKDSHPGAKYQIKDKHIPLITCDTNLTLTAKHGKGVLRRVLYIIMSITEPRAFTTACILNCSVSADYLYSRNVQLQK